MGIYCGRGEMLFFGKIKKIVLYVGIGHMLRLFPDEIQEIPNETVMAPETSLLPITTSYLIPLLKRRRLCGLIIGKNLNIFKFFIKSEIMGTHPIFISFLSS